MYGSGNMPRNGIPLNKWLSGNASQNNTNVTNDENRQRATETQAL